MSLRTSPELPTVSPLGRHRAALRSLAGSTSSMFVMTVALGTGFVATGADWYFLPGLACVYLLMLVLEYRHGLRHSNPGA